MSFWVEANVISQLKLNLRDADLTGADLRDMNLKDAMLICCNLTGANLQRVALQKADLSCAIFDEAILVDAKLTEAKLWRARFRKASLRDAVLNKAVLSDAELQPWGKKHGALLNGSDLRKVTLKSANLSGVYLHHTKNLTDAQILQSCDWDQAIHTKAVWNANNKCWDVTDPQANTRRICQLRNRRG